MAAVPDQFLSPPRDPFAGSLAPPAPSYAVDPFLRPAAEDKSAKRLAASDAFRTRLGKAIDKLSAFFGAGIAIRHSDGTMDRVRLPVRPGDITVLILFGNPPADTPAGPGEAASQALRREATVAGLTCTAAVIGWIGFCAAAFVAGPGGWIVLVLLGFDGIASGVASVSCLESGVRVLNEARGRHDRNEAMDSNKAFAVSSRAQDGLTLLSVPRAAMTAVPKMARVASQAAAVARPGSAVVSGARVVREVFLNKEVRVDLVNTVAAVIGAVGSAEGGVLGEALTAFPTFTVAVTN